MQTTVLVTGATSGIGLATAAELVSRGLRVLVHGRSEASSTRIVNELLERHPNGAARPVWGDLSVLSEVRRLAAMVEEEHQLDVLLHNAGVERWERETTADGFELTLTVNHLAPFLLTRLLMPVLERAPRARVVFVSSMVHGWGQIHWDDMDAASWYSPEPVYYQSKLAAALTAQEFARRLAQKGISVLLVPPGLTQTRFARDFRGMAGWWSRLVGPLLFRQPKDVATELACVCLEERFGSASGGYIDRLEVGYPAQNARVAEHQLRLWNWTCERLGLPNDEPPRGDPLPRVILKRPRFGPWIRGVTFGETIGFTATALVAYLGLMIGGRPSTISGRVVALVLMVFAGTIEGACLGFFQWRLLKRWLPDLSARRFIGSTIAVAAGGWFVGMSVPLLMTLTGSIGASNTSESPRPWSVAIFAIIFGAIAGLLFGVAQGLALRKHVDNVGWWVAGNSIGWAVGLPLSYLAGSLGHAQMSLWMALMLSASAAMGMGACVSLGTFAAMKQMSSLLQRDDDELGDAKPRADGEFNLLDA